MDFAVPYHCLDDPSAMFTLWRFLLPSLPWNLKRFLAFKNTPILAQKPTLSSLRFDLLKAFLSQEVEPL
jgi:hypothetical protein